MLKQTFHKLESRLRETITVTKSYNEPAVIAVTVKRSLPEFTKKSKYSRNERP